MIKIQVTLYCLAISIFCIIQLILEKDIFINLIIRQFTTSQVYTKSLFFKHHNLSH